VNPRTLQTALIEVVSDLLSAENLVPTLSTGFSSHMAQYIRNFITLPISAWNLISFFQIVRETRNQVTVFYMCFWMITAVLIEKNQVNLFSVSCSKV
jgi:hypothetical protein